MVRPATETDLWFALELGRKGHAATGIPVPYEPEAAANLFLGLVRIGGCFVSDRGMIGGAPTPLPYGKTPAFAVVLFWWGGDCLALLKQFRKRWAPLPVRFAILDGNRARAFERATGCTIRETYMGDV